MQNQTGGWLPAKVLAWGLPLAFVLFLAGLVLGRETGGDWDLEPGGKSLLKINRHTGEVRMWQVDGQTWVMLGP